MASKPTYNGDLIADVKAFLSIPENAEKLQTSVIEHGLSGSEIAFSIDLSKLDKCNSKLFDFTFKEPDAVAGLFRNELPKDCVILFENPPEYAFTELSKLRHRDSNTLICAQGILLAITKPLSLLVKPQFECVHCGALIFGKVIDDVVCSPHLCTCGRKDCFRFDSNPQISGYVDYIDVIIEEGLEEAEAKRQPDFFYGRLLGSLASEERRRKLVIGDKINFIGIVRLKQVRKGKMKTAFFENYMELFNCSPLKIGFDSIKLTKEEEDEIIKFAKTKDVKTEFLKYFDNIYGLENEKLACLLQLFEGTPKENRLGKYSRNLIHIAIIGDTSVAKTELQNSMATIHPRHVLLNADLVSKIGLCVVPETLIATETGLMPIKELVENQFNSSNPTIAEGNHEGVSVKGLKIVGCGEDVDVETAWKIKNKQNLIKLILSNGKCLTTTPQTPIMTDVGWVRTANLRLGDKIKNDLIKTPKEDFDILNLLNDDERLFVRFNLKNFMQNKKMTYAELAHLIGFPHNYNAKLYSSAHHNRLSLASVKKLFAIYEREIYEYFPEKRIEINPHNHPPIFLPLFLDDFLMYFAGLVAGDGDVLHSGVRLHSNNESFLNQITAELFKRYGIKAPIAKCGWRIPCFRGGGKVLRDLFINLGIPAGEKSGTVALNPKLLRSKYANYFLRGLFDTDGAVNLTKNKNRIQSIELYSCSKQLIQQTQLLLESYGIRSQISKREPTKPTITKLGHKIIGKLERHRLTISGVENYLAFDKIIGFLNEKKKNRLLLAYNTINRRSPYKTINDYSEIIALNDIDASQYPMLYDLTTSNHAFSANGITTHNTAMVEKDENTGKEYIKAGALMKASGGLCLISEFDSMPKEIQATLASPMEEGVMGLAKFAISAEFRVTPSILVTGNPAITGVFDRAQKAASQLPINPKLISRFDLIFAIYDTPESNRDKKITQTMRRSIHTKTEFPSAETEKKKEFADFIKKYIAYAKKHYLPSLGDDESEAVRKLDEYYDRMRKLSVDGRIVIKPRNYQGLIRLSEAHAKLHLRNKVLEEDVDVAISLFDAMAQSLQLVSENGLWDTSIIQGVQPKSIRDQQIQLLQLLNDMHQKTDVVLESDFIEKAQELGFNKFKILQFIEEMCRIGEAFRPKTGQIRPSRS